MRRFERGLTPGEQLVGVVAALFIAAHVPLIVVVPHGAVTLVFVTGVCLSFVIWGRVTPKLMLVCLFLTIAIRSQEAHGSLVAAESRQISQTQVELINDPVAHRWGAAVQVELDGQRLRMNLSGQDLVIQELLAGDRLVVDGVIAGQMPTSSWDRARRTVGSLGATRLASFEPARFPYGLANTLRRNVEGGAVSINREHRPLFTGLVYGDDRSQSARLSDAFQAAGLGHLLAVSGQNVVFVLALAWPVLTRIDRSWQRWVAAVGLLLLFGFMTRFEPSVTRAIIMASVALGLRSAGRSRATNEVLPLALALLLLVDPLQAQLLGLQLSVAATLGLILVAPSVRSGLEAVLPTLSIDAPGSVARPLSAVLFGWARQSVVTGLSATVGAQSGVCPLLLWYFGSIPLASIPANLAAGPIAGALMMWGLTAGSVAGLVGGTVAKLIHLPTRIGLWSLDSIATMAAENSIGELRFVHCAVILCCLLLLRQNAWTTRALVAQVALIATLIAPLGFTGLPTGHRHELGEGISLIETTLGHTVVVISQEPDVANGLEVLRRAGVSRIDLLIATDGGRGVGRFVQTLSGRHQVELLIAPPIHSIRGAEAIFGATVYPLGQYLLVAAPDPTGTALLVDVTTSV